MLYASNICILQCNPLLLLQILSVCYCFRLQFIPIDFALFSLSKGIHHRPELSLSVGKFEVSIEEGVKTVKMANWKNIPKLLNQKADVTFQPNIYGEVILVNNEFCPATLHNNPVNVHVSPRFTLRTCWIDLICIT